MTDDDVAGRITAFIKERFLDGDPRGELDERTPLLEWGVLNSLNTVVLLTFVRDELGVTVPPARINAQDLKNVQSIAGMVRGLASARS
ncbi:phosphopantetheine-binding protein [Micromonospora sp. NPDC051196]|uniref:acyl carrier protein n=1 Tax=Micromonospora sp. NPDC051196 TaxID=3155281 RepID=UPI00342BD75A